MDDIVKAALKKWPNVPDCYGWLALDARGDWYMRDDRTQAAGPFPQVKGSRVNRWYSVCVLLGSWVDRLLRSKTTQVGRLARSRPP
jgi:hypothetical protein